MKLTKSRDDVLVSGVLGGLGEYYNIDPTLLRIGFVVLAFLGVGFVIPLYIAAAFIMPEAPEEGDQKRDFNRRSPRNFRKRRDFYKTTHSEEKQTRDQKEQTTKAKDINEDDWSDF